MAERNTDVCGYLVFRRPNTPIASKQSVFELKYGHCVRIGSKDGDDIRLKHFTDARTDAILNISESSGYVQVSNPEHTQTLINDVLLSKPKYLIPGDTLYIKNKIFIYQNDNLKEEDISWLKTKNARPLREAPTKRKSVATLCNTAKDEGFTAPEPTALVYDTSRVQIGISSSRIDNAHCSHTNRQSLRRATIHSDVAEVSDQDLLWKTPPSQRISSIKTPSRKGSTHKFLTVLEETIDQPSESDNVFGIRSRSAGRLQKSLTHDNIFSPLASSRKSLFAGRRSRSLDAVESDIQIKKQRTLEGSRNGRKSQELAETALDIQTSGRKLINRRTSAKLRKSAIDRRTSLNSSSSVEMMSSIQQASPLQQVLLGTDGKSARLSKFKTNEDENSTYGQDVTRLCTPTIDEYQNITLETGNNKPALEQSLLASGRKSSRLSTFQTENDGYHQRGAEKSYDVQGTSYTEEAPSDSKRKFTNKRSSAIVDTSTIDEAQNTTLETSNTEIMPFSFSERNSTGLSKLQTSTTEEVQGNTYQEEAVQLEEEQLASGRKSTNRRASARLHISPIGEDEKTPLQRHNIHVSLLDSRRKSTRLSVQNSQNNIYDEDKTEKLLVLHEKSLLEKTPSTTGILCTRLSKLQTSIPPDPQNNTYEEDDTEELLNLQEDSYLGEELLASGRKSINRRSSGRLHNSIIEIDNKTFEASNDDIVPPTQMSSVVGSGRKSIRLSKVQTSTTRETEKTLDAQESSLEEAFLRNSSNRRTSVRLNSSAVSEVGSITSDEIENSTSNEIGNNSSVQGKAGKTLNLQELYIEETLASRRKSINRRSSVRLNNSTIYITNNSTLEASTDEIPQIQDISTFVGSGRKSNGLSKFGNSTTEDTANINLKGETEKTLNLQEESYLEKTTVPSGRKSSNRLSSRLRTSIVDDVKNRSLEMTPQKEEASPLTQFASDKTSTNGRLSMYQTQDATFEEHKTGEGPHLEESVLTSGRKSSNRSLARLQNTIGNESDDDLSFASGRKSARRSSVRIQNSTMIEHDDVVFETPTVKRKRSLAEGSPFASGKKSSKGKHSAKFHSSGRSACLQHSLLEISAKKRMSANDLSLLLQTPIGFNRAVRRRTSARIRNYIIEKKKRDEVDEVPSILESLHLEELPKRSSSTARRRRSKIKSKPKVTQGVASVISFDEEPVNLGNTSGKKSMSIVDSLCEQVQVSPMWRKRHANLLNQGKSASFSVGHQQATKITESLAFSRNRRSLPALKIKSVEQKSNENRTNLIVPQYEDITMDEEVFLEKLENARSPRKTRSSARSVESVHVDEGEMNSEEEEGEINISGVERLQKSPNNDLTDVVGVKRLFAKQSLQSPKLQGVKAMFNSERSPTNDLTDTVGVKKLFEKSPLNDLSNVQGIKHMFRMSPKNDLSTVPKIKNIFKNSPLNDLSNLRGVKDMYRAGPANDLTNVGNIKNAFTKSPKNDITDVRGVKRMFASNTPKNDLRNVDGVKNILQVRSPINDLTNVSAVRTLCSTEKLQNTSRKGEIAEENDAHSDPNDSFDALIGKLKHKTYSRSYTSIGDVSTVVSPDVSKKVINDSITETFYSIKKKRKLAKTPRQSFRDSLQNSIGTDSSGKSPVADLARLSSDLFNAKKLETSTTGREDGADQTPSKPFIEPHFTIQTPNVILNVEIGNTSTPVQTRTRRNLVKQELSVERSLPRSTRRNAKNNSIQVYEKQTTPAINSIKKLAVKMKNESFGAVDITQTDEGIIDNVRRGGPTRRDQKKEDSISVEIETETRYENVSSAKRSTPASRAKRNDDSVKMESKTDVTLHEYEGVVEENRTNLKKRTRNHGDKGDAQKSSSGEIQKNAGKREEKIKNVPKIKGGRRGKAAESKNKVQQLEEHKHIEDTKLANVNIVEEKKEKRIAGRRNRNVKSEQISEELVEEIEPQNKKKPTTKRQINKKNEEDKEIVEKSVELPKSRRGRGKMNEEIAEQSEDEITLQSANKPSAKRQTRKKNERNDEESKPVEVSTTRRGQRRKAVENKEEEKTDIEQIKEDIESSKQEEKKEVEESQTQSVTSAAALRKTRRNNKVSVEEINSKPAESLIPKKGRPRKGTEKEEMVAKEQKEAEQADEETKDIKVVEEKEAKRPLRGKTLKKDEVGNLKRGRKRKSTDLELENDDTEEPKQENEVEKKTKSGRRNKTTKEKETVDKLTEDQALSTKTNKGTAEDVAEEKPQSAKENKRQPSARQTRKKNQGSVEESLLEGKPQRRTLSKERSTRQTRTNFEENNEKEGDMVEDSSEDKPQSTKQNKGRKTRQTRKNEEENHDEQNKGKSAGQTKKKSQGNEAENENNGENLTKSRRAQRGKAPDIKIQEEVVKDKAVTNKRIRSNSELESTPAKKTRRKNNEEAKGAMEEQQKVTKGGRKRQANEVQEAVKEDVAIRRSKRARK